MGISGVFCELKILKFRSQTSTKGGVVRGVFVRGAAKAGKNEHHAEHSTQPLDTNTHTPHIPGPKITPRADFYIRESRVGESL